MIIINQPPFFHLHNYDESVSDDSDAMETPSSETSEDNVSIHSPGPSLILPSISPTNPEMIAASSLLGLAHGKFPQINVATLLMQNLQLASDIIKYVKRAVPFAGNNDIRGQIHTQHLDQASFEAFSKRMVIQYGRLSEEIDCDDDEDSDEDLIANWSEYAKLIEKCKIGNCRELSIVGFACAVEKVKLRHIEIFEIIDGDHVFLVLGRNPESDPENYHEWGPTAVICDPWAEIFYPAAKILDYLQDFKGINEVDGKVIPILAPFDPSNQSVDLLLSPNDVFIECSS